MYKYLKKTKSTSDNTQLTDQPMYRGEVGGGGTVKT